MILSGKLPWGILRTLTPTAAPSRTSLSSMTPRKDLEETTLSYKTTGRDLDNRWSLDKVLDGVS